MLELRKELKALGAPVGGNKKDLLDRLEKLKKKESAAPLQNPQPVANPGASLAEEPEEPGSPGALSEAPKTERRLRKRRLKEQIAKELDEEGLGQQGSARAQVIGLGCPLGHL